ncbi:MAG TPA: hypothetical protein VHL78_02805 [Actinomycetota bacterium]|nr:hypothetical protein [Actinomycetota bacterium]
MRRERVVVGIFPSAWEAEMARRYLDEAGISAWLDELVPDHPGHLGEGRPVRLYVSREDEDDALAILEDTDPADDDDLEAARAAQRRRPLWIAAVALLVLVGMVIAAVPQVLWVPLLAVAFFGVILWQLVRPAPRR